jgi:hypothetical protein
MLGGRYAFSFDLVLINVLITENRLAYLLKLLVVLICLAEILHRILPLLGMGDILWAGQRSYLFVHLRGLVAP